jgi:hypothetical protein
MLGLQFGVSRTTANDIFHNWIPIIQDLLTASLIEAASDLDMLAELRAELAQQELLVDSSEQVRARPVDNKEQRRYYSGKQARHTFKAQFITLERGANIVDVVTAKRGPEADINIMREQHYLGDKAYVGEAQILTPKKKPKGGQLTSEEKENNRLLSQRRIYVEHLIRRVKIFRVLKDKFRLRSSVYERVMLTICGLTRLRMGTFKFAGLYWGK